MKHHAFHAAVGRDSVPSRREGLPTYQGETPDLPKSTRSTGARSGLRILPVLMLMSSLSLFSQPSKWLTPCERSGFLETPRYRETMEYCRRLEKASRWIKVTSFGVSPEGRDLPLVILSKDRAFTAKKAAGLRKAILLVQNGIHAGEIEGKDACLMLMRDIAVTKTKEHLLDSVILLVIPIYNVDGHERFGPYNRINQNGPREMGWRVTAQNLNLNRDYMKADAPETQAWLKMFNAWLPDFFIDCHVTDGADYQFIVTYGIETKENVAPPVRSWLTGKFLPALSGVTTHGVPFGPLIYLRDDLDPMKGLAGPSATGPPRFSTVYTTLRNRPGMLVEMHMLKDYRSRVEGNYAILEATMQRLNEEAASLRRSVRLADRQTASGIFDRPLPIAFRDDSVPSGTVRFLGVRQRNEPSGISGATRRLYTDDQFEADIPIYDSVLVAKSVTPPYAYLIPPQWAQAIERLKLHGLELRRLKNLEVLDVEEYRFSNPSWHQTPFEGRHQVDYTVDTVRERKLFPKGTVVVLMNQPAAKVAVNLLEPEAPDALAAWGFFDAVFEQKEYAEDYVMDTLALQMIARDPALRKDFEEKLQTDTAFARSPFQRLNYFYRRSKYWDNQVNLYPVARLTRNARLSLEPMP